MQAAAPQQPTQYVYMQAPQQQANSGMKLADNIYKDGKNIAETAYEGSASLGKVVGIFGASMGILIGLIILGIGLFLIFKKETRNTVDATIKKADCKETIQEVNNKRTIYQNCVLDISYVAIDGKTYEAKITTDGKNYVEGQTIKVSYDITNPRDIVIQSVSTRTIGWIAFTIGLFLFGGSSFSLYLTLKFKAYAAAQGAATVFGVVDNAFD